LLLTLTTIILFSCSQKVLAQQWEPQGTNNIRNTNAGNVGIGTDSDTPPASKLDVRGRIQQTGSTTDAGYLLTNGGLLANTTALNPGIAFYGGNGFNALYGADLGFNSSTGRYRTRLFSGNVLADVALGRQQDVQANPTQSAFIEFLTIRGDTGYVGIGTATPNYSLEVSNPTRVFPAINVMTSAHPTSERATIGFGLNAAVTQGWVFGQDRAADGTRDMYLFDVSNNRDVMYWGTNGNVGIGTTAPGFKFDVNGEINATGFRINGIPLSTGGGAVSSVFGRTGAVVQQAGDYTWAQINKSTSSLADIATRSAGDLSSGTLLDARFPTTLPAVSGANLTALNASNLSNGTVPIARLGSGTADSTKFLRGDNTWAVPAGTSQWTTIGGNINYASGNVGINNTNATAKLHVNGVGPSGTAAFAGTNSTSHFNFNGDNSEDTYIRGGKATSRVLIGDSNAGNVLVALGGGNVGIGSATPTVKLFVSGDGRFTGALTVDGNIAAKYQDVAEWVPAEEQLAAGTVVVLDANKPNHVISSNTSYDTRVAGVISEQPGIMLGEKGDNKVLVATTGRVKVKVDATSGPIQIGDLLVTSDREGFAMKSLPVEIGGGFRMHRPATLIGKALEPLSSGTGEILVLLSLQ
jgi:hypothetical protein